MPQREGSTQTLAPVLARQLYRPAEVAQMLGLGRSTVYALIECGEVRAVRIGTAVRIPADEVRRLGAEGTAVDA